MSLLDRSDTFREGSTIVLETERLRLRAPRLEDAKAIAMLVNDRRIAENTIRIPHPYSLADAKEWIGSVRGSGEESFLITVAGEVVGGCGCHHRDGVPEIGYWLGVPFWGNGYATEAARALIDHVFDTHSPHMLVAGARISNPASRRVLEKCGFQWNGVGLYRIRAIRSSAPFDRFRLERTIWASLKSWAARARSRNVSADFNRLILELCDARRLQSSAEMT